MSAIYAENHQNDPCEATLSEQFAGLVGSAYGRNGRINLIDFCEVNVPTILTALRAYESQSGSIAQAIEQPRIACADKADEIARGFGVYRDHSGQQEGAETVARAIRGLTVSAPPPLDDAVAKAVAAEREACAAICDSEKRMAREDARRSHERGNDVHETRLLNKAQMAAELASLIRARTTTLSPSFDEAAERKAFERWYGAPRRLERWGAWLARAKMGRA